MSRRTFLAESAGAITALAAIPVLSTLSGCAAAAKPTAKDTAARSRYLLSGYYDSHGGGFHIGVLDLRQRSFKGIPVEHRGHGLCLHPTKAGHAIIFAQRPGTVSYEFDYVNAKVTNEFRTGPERHFYGHGIGVVERGILCTENKYDAGGGVIAVRNPDTYEIESEFPSYGTGPHDMRLLHGGKTLAVANGGKIKDDDEKPLPSEQIVAAKLSLIDVASGELTEQQEFPGMLLKHMHATPNDTLALALRGSVDALVIVRHADGTLVRAEDRGNMFEAMQRHTLSIRACDQSGLVACSSPFGGLVGFWDMRSGKLRHMRRIAGASGVELTHDQRYFYITSAGTSELEGLTNATAVFKAGDDGTITKVDAATASPVVHGLPQSPGIAWLSHTLAAEG